MVIVIGSLVNVIGHILTVYWAKSENKAMDEQVMVLKAKKADLTAKIKSATSAAFISQEVHDKLGWGGENDYRIILPKEHSFDSIYSEVNIGDEIPYWKQWWNWVVHK